MRTIVFAAVLALGSVAGAGAEAAQPYAGLETRPVKALSEQQIADLKAGRGAGFALPAELNGYPGPVHVLELADKLGLDPEQRRSTQGLFDAMKAEAVPLGETIVAQEERLDRLFATKTIEVATLDDATRSIAETQGRLRAAHLRYHLAMMDVLTPDQVARYSVLRGYGTGNGAPAHGHGSHPR
jgi:Spy/CpxP family protein refolding chaperone